MNLTASKILVAQTLYLGDLILTVPLIEKLKSEFPEALIDVLLAKKNEEILTNHPAVNSVITYDKDKVDRGLSGIFSVAGKLRYRHYDIAIVLNGSVRSSLAVYLAGIKRRIGTDQSTGINLFVDKVKFPQKSWDIPGGKIMKIMESFWRLVGKNYSFVSSLYTDIVRIDPMRHAVGRNLQLLEPLNIFINEEEFQAKLYPESNNYRNVTDLINQFNKDGRKIVAVAPGSNWYTKRWLTENFIQLITLLIENEIRVALVGGSSDADICKTISGIFNSDLVINVSGKFSVLESVVLLQNCSLLITNDSGAMHIGVVARIPCLIILGPTVPEFGFVPVGPKHKIISSGGLWCRPCTPFGGRSCPVKTFDCMKNITPDMVFNQIVDMIK